jgi:hypothetical protein
MAYAPPDPKKVAHQRREQQAQQQIETCYRVHKVAQQRYAESQR